MHDIFKCYRREGGSDLARSVTLALKARGFSVFMDVEDLKSGPFDEALIEKFEEATDFIVIMSPGCLVNCKNEGDWLRKEISCALRCCRNIVPVFARGFQMPLTSELPSDIADLLR